MIEHLLPKITTVHSSAKAEVGVAAPLAVR